MKLENKFTYLNTIKNFEIECKANNVEGSIIDILIGGTNDYQKNKNR